MADSKVSNDKLSRWQQLKKWRTAPLESPRWTKPTPLVVLGFVVALGGLFYLVIAIPQWQTVPLSQESLAKKLKDLEALSAQPSPQPSPSPQPNPEAAMTVKDVAAIEKGRLDTENAFRTALIQGIGGTVLLIGLYFTYQNLRATQRNVEIAEDKQVTERFCKAVEMLSSGNMHTCLGGIYALERIARDSDDDYWQVMEVLTAFVRSESPWPPKTEKSESEGTTAAARAADQVEAPLPMVEGLVAPSALVGVVEASQSTEPQPELSDPEQQRQVLEQGLKELEERRARLAKLPPLRTDIQAVMTVLGRRQHRYEEGETQRLDLRQTDLRKLQAPGANLTGIILFGSNLQGANLWEADLQETGLQGADLWGASLNPEQLRKAWIDKDTISPYLLAAQPQTQAPITPPSPTTPEPNAEP